MQLSADDDKTTLACKLLYSPNNQIIPRIRRQILVVLCLKSKWNTILGKTLSFASRETS